MTIHLITVWHAECSGQGVVVAWTPMLALSARPEPQAEGDAAAGSQADETRVELDQPLRAARSRTPASPAARRLRTPSLQGRQRFRSPVREAIRSPDGRSLASSYASFGARTNHFDTFLGAYPLQQIASSHLVDCACKVVGCGRTFSSHGSLRAHMYDVHLKAGQINKVTSMLSLSRDHIDWRARAKKE